MAGPRTERLVRDGYRGMTAAQGHAVASSLAALALVVLAVGLVALLVPETGSVANALDGF